MTADTMTPKQRVGAFLAGQTTDRLICAPLILNHAARVLGVKVSEYARSGDLMGQAHVAAYHRYGHDLITIFSDTSVISEAMGTVLHYADDDAPRVEEPVVKTASDVAALLVPDPLRDGRLPVLIRAIELANAEVGEEVFVSCCYAMPFTIAAALMGTDVFVKSLRKAPETAHALLDVSLQASLAVTDAILTAGGIPVPVDPVASCSVIGPGQFRQFVLPYTRAVIERIHAAGLPGILHVCGASNLIWDLMADTGADVISVDRVDLEEVKRAVGHRVCLLGNVSTARTLLNGNPQDVIAETRECIRKAHDSPRGYIVATGCEVPLMTPPENIDAMMEAVRRYGRLPINPESWGK